MPIPLPKELVEKLVEWKKNATSICGEHGPLSFQMKEEFSDLIRPWINEQGLRWSHVICTKCWMAFTKEERRAGIVEDHHGERNSVV
jgi:hypothetical protein